MTFASIPWSYSHSPLFPDHSIHSFPSYEADKNHIRAKYYAKRAHDLAKLRSSIYGIGFPLYGFRYGSHFPKYIPKPFPLLPFVTKYPVYSFDWDDIPLSFPDHFFFDNYHYPSISEHLIGFRYPKTYHKSYSHGYEKGYAYEKGYSKGHEHSYGHSTPYHHGYYGYPILPHPSKYIKKQYKQYPGDTIFYKPIHKPYNHGYEYAWEKKTPDYGKHITPLEFNEHHALHDDQFTDIGKGHVPNKFQLESIGYEAVPLKSGDYGLDPSSEVELSGKFYEKGPYIPDHDSIEEKFSDLKSDDNFPSLNIHHGLKDFKFDDKDFIAHGSEKSENKIKA